MKSTYLMPCSLAEMVEYHAQQAHAQLAQSTPQAMTDAERAIVNRLFAESERDLALYGQLIPGGESEVAA